jgi:hypothetical protein
VSQSTKYTRTTLATCYSRWLAYWWLDLLALLGALGPMPSAALRSYAVAQFRKHRPRYSMLYPSIQL